MEYDIKGIIDMKQLVNPNEIPTIRIEMLDREFPETWKLHSIQNSYETTAKLLDDSPYYLRAMLCMGRHRKIIQKNF